jgi:hypothetical protein
MEILFELLRNLVATFVSVGTLIVMFSRHLNKERLLHSKQISDIIDKTASKVFSNAQLEQRVKQLESQEKANQEYMRESFAKVNDRLDQIYSIVAGIKK